MQKYLQSVKRAILKVTKCLNELTSNLLNSHVTSYSLNELIFSLRFSILYLFCLWWLLVQALGYKLYNPVLNLYKILLLYLFEGSYLLYKLLIYILSDHLSYKKNWQKTLVQVLINMILSISENIMESNLEVLTCEPVFWFYFNNFKSTISLDSFQISSRSISKSTQNNFHLSFCKKINLFHSINGMFTERYLELCHSTSVIFQFNFAFHH